MQRHTSDNKHLVIHWVFIGFFSSLVLFVLAYFTEILTYPPKNQKYGKPRLGESTLTYIGLDTPNLAYINFFVLRTLGGVPVKKHPVYRIHFK